jgi:hypothetical protein
VTHGSHFLHESILLVFTDVIETVGDSGQDVIGLEHRINGQ